MNLWGPHLVSYLSHTRVLTHGDHVGLGRRRRLLQSRGVEEVSQLPMKRRQEYKVDPVGTSFDSF